MWAFRHRKRAGGIDIRFRLRSHGLEWTRKEIYEIKRSKERLKQGKFSRWRQTTTWPFVFFKQWTAEEG